MTIMKKISIITPIYNESQSIPLLVDELKTIMSKSGFKYEIIAVNDGSKDDTENVLSDIAQKNKELKVINFNSNKGQSAALSAGIEKSTGDIIVTIDSDLENDPNDILNLINTMSKGYDVVSGWRDGRWEGNYFSRKLPSKIANTLISKITKVKLNDYGCTLKAYSRRVIEDVHLYGEMHRFIPAYTAWNGGNVTEVKVSFRPRRFGKSNYGISRTFKVLLDLITIKYFMKYMNKPMHFFGGIGFISLFVGSLSGLLSIFLKIIHVRDFVSTPLPIFSALFIIVGIQLITMGILAEIMMRTYYESQGKKPYSIKSLINF
jgi:glycosyltransferase involved in cell wall biosynthesis